MTKYLPIRLSSLREDTTIGCDIYLIISIKGSSRYVLYCKGDAIFENKKKELLVKKNVNRLFISRHDQQKYFIYLESNFQNIMSDTRIPPVERAQIVHNTAVNLVKDVYKNPKIGNIERSKTFAYNMVDYILKDGRTAFGLIKIASHEYHTFTHSVNVAVMGTLFAKNLGLGEEDLKPFCTGTLLHDLGKTEISADILNKKGRLTEEEFQKIKEHPELGVAILKETGNGLNEEYAIILQHHENYDGTGYPYGLKKDEIHSGGKIARIIDIYDALTKNRPYSNALTPYNAVKKIKDEMLDAVDKVIFKRFIRFLGGYRW